MHKHGTDSERKECKHTSAHMDVMDITAGHMAVYMNIPACVTVYKNLGPQCSYYTDTIQPFYSHKTLPAHEHKV